jgi:hypothetical protein
MLFGLYDKTVKLISKSKKIAKFNRPIKNGQFCERKIRTRIQVRSATPNGGLV